MVYTRTYIHVHTGTHGGGEIRGNKVPEPSVCSPALLGAVGLAASPRLL